MRNLSKQETVELRDIYEAAAGKGIEIYGFSLPLCSALSVMDGSGKCVIGMDNSRRYSAAEEKTMLLHELGHCETGAFYNEYTPFSIVSKCEKKADEWAIRSFLPYEKLIAAFKEGVSSDFELAEYFGVSEQFIVKAKEYYLQRGEGYGAYGKNGKSGNDF